jgi:hypothetical protein
MRNLFNVINSIQISGKWIVINNKSYTLQAETRKYNSPIFTWEEIEENQYYFVERETDIQGIDLKSIQQNLLLDNFTTFIKLFDLNLRNDNESDIFTFFQFMVFTKEKACIRILYIFNQRKSLRLIRDFLLH